jgi:Na+-transporting methylmalonyl-CoA/oxaloacetate decarboxylase gamma subunit
LCGIASAAFAFGEREQELIYQSSWTLKEFAEANQVPPRKISTTLGEEFDTRDSTTLSELGITRRDAKEAFEEYRKEELSFLRNIAEIGMLIVFLSLIIVAVLIGLLRHLHIFERKGNSRKPEKRSVRSMVGTISSSGDMSDYALAAVVAAIFLHEEEVEEENRLLLTWKRASTNMWKASRSMPNDTFFNARGGRR